MRRRSLRSSVCTLAQLQASSLRCAVGARTWSGCSRMHARSFKVNLTYSNTRCLLILACHRAIVGDHLVASFQTAPLPTVAT